MSALPATPTSTPADIAARRRAVMIRSLFGDLIGGLVQQDGLTDIIANSDGKVWATVTGQGKRLAGRIDPHEAEKLILAVASNVGEHVGRDAPSLAAEVELGGQQLRFQGFLTPVTPAPAFSIRKPPTRIYTLADYVADGVLTEAQRALLEQAVAGKKNVLITGGTGSGKSTLMNALLEAVARLTPDDRVVMVERTRELQCKVVDAEYLRVTDTYTAQRALQDVLRSYPDRIMVGEVRGAEALEMLMAWNTGHDGGFCTVHAKTSRPSPRAGLLRIEQAASLAATTSPLRLQPMIGEVVDLVVCIAKSNANPAGRVVSYIGAVNGWDGNDYRIEEDTTP